MIFCNAKIIIVSDLEIIMMAKVGRPKGNNNKAYNYTLRMDDDTKVILETYCSENNVSKSVAIREAIILLQKHKEKNRIR